MPIVQGCVSSPVTIKENFNSTLEHPFCTTLSVVLNWGGGEGRGPLYMRLNLYPRQRNEKLPDTQSENWCSRIHDVRPLFVWSISLYFCVNDPFARTTQHLIFRVVLKEGFHFTCMTNILVEAEMYCLWQSLFSSHSLFQVLWGNRRGADVGEEDGGKPKAPEESARLRKSQQHTRPERWW